MLWGLAEGKHGESNILVEFHEDNQSVESECVTLWNENRTVCSVVNLQVAVLYKVHRIQGGDPEQHDEVK